MNKAPKDAAALEETRDGKLIELSARVDGYRKKKRRRLLFVLLALLLFLALFLLLYTRLEYKNYKVLSRYTRTDSGSGAFVEVNGTLIRYSADGATGLSHTGEELWTESYVMQTPMAAVCGDMLAITEKDGNRIYLFNADGKQGEIATAYPIQTISVSAQGIVAAIMQEDAASLIYAYDRNGNTLIESQATPEDTGFPVSAAISEDGTRLLVSYVKTEDTVTSRVVAYRFGTEEAESGDYIILEETYEDVLFSYVYFIGNYTAVAIGDGKVCFYSGAETMSEEVSLSFEETIVSAAKDSEHLGLVLKKESAYGETAYEVVMLDRNGGEEMRRTHTGDITSLDLKDGKLIVFHDTRCTMYTGSGRMLFEGEFNESVEEIFPMGGLNKYFVITRDTFETVRLVR